MPEEKRLIELKDATIVADDVVAVAKMQQPATLQTPVIPFLHIVLRNVLAPLVLAYTTDEEIEEAYAKVQEGMRA